MAGIKWLYISNSGQVYKIPNPKKFLFKPVSALAGESVLDVCIVYETRDRKPWRIIKFYFDRINLNSEGQYVMTDDEVQRGMRNFRIFGFANAKDISKRNGPLPIPDAPIIPNEIEKKALINYLNTELPILWDNSPNALELEIRLAQERHEKQIEIIREASNLRKINGKKE